MRVTIVMLWVVCSSICFTQTDSIFVENMDGTITGYPISSIRELTFNITDPVGVQEDKKMQEILSAFMLHQNYPNPFNPSTTIQYSIPTKGDVKIHIYDIQGRIVRSFNADGEFAGNHSIVWDSRNDHGASVSSGTYICQILFNNNSLVKKLLLIK